MTEQHKRRIYEIGELIQLSSIAIAVGDRSPIDGYVARLRGLVEQAHQEAETLKPDQAAVIVGETTEAARSMMELVQQQPA